MGWHAQLALDYRACHGRTVLHFTHDGPLRVLKSLYPEGPAICHNVLVHPPGGLVGGDELDITVQVGAGAHALVTTPGAARFYKSNGQPARQRTRLRLATGARLEWLPLEAIAYNACDAHNHLEFELAEGAQMLAWDITALGLPLAGQAFALGRLTQHLEWPGVYLERGLIDAQDGLLLDGDLGLAGQRCLANLVLASGTPLPRSTREQLLDGMHALLQSGHGSVLAGVTAPNDHMLVLRALAPVVEPAMALCRSAWSLWRGQLWGLRGDMPRIWAM